MEEDISDHLIGKSQCEIDFGKMITSEEEQSDPVFTKTDSLEICNPSTENVQGDVILEAKIITRQDTIQESTVESKNDGLVLATPDEIKPEIDVANEDTSKDIIINEESSKDVVIEENTVITEPAPDKEIKIEEISLPVNKIPATEIKTEQPPSPKKKSPRKDRLLSNYDIIDRTEAKKIEQETNVFSLGNLVGRFKRAFGHVEHPPYRRQSTDSNQSSSSHLNSVVNLSIEQTKSGEPMQVSS